MDGVGGYLKRTTDRHVLIGNHIKTTSDFANLFINSAIKVKVIPEEDMIKVNNNVPKALDAIPGIMNIPKITWQRGTDVSIQIYRYGHFHKNLKLSALSSHLNVSSFEAWMFVCLR